MTSTTLFKRIIINKRGIFMFFLNTCHVCLLQGRSINGKVRYKQSPGNQLSLTIFTFRTLFSRSKLDSSWVRVIPQFFPGTVCVVKHEAGYSTMVDIRNTSIAGELQIKLTGFTVVYSILIHIHPKSRNSRYV